MPSTLTTRGFMSCNQIRLDINPAAAPAVISSMTDMAAVATASVQAVFTSHNIEHLASKPARSEQEMMALMQGHQGVGAELWKCLVESCGGREERESGWRNDNAANACSAGRGCWLRRLPDGSAAG
jgi:hypothetical protein